MTDTEFLLRKAIKNYGRALYSLQQIEKERLSLPANFLSGALLAQMNNLDNQKREWEERAQKELEEIKLLAVNYFIEGR